MDKLKHMFRPGGEKDDSVLYGTPNPDDTPAKLTTDPAADKHDHGIMRQLLNPGGDKHDEERFGTTAHADKPLNFPTSGTEPQATSETSRIQSGPAADDKQGITRQLLNPGGEKYDPKRYEETGKERAATSDPTHTEPEPLETEKDGVLRQILNPGGEKYDPVRHGEAGKAPAATGPTLIKSEPAATDKQGIMRQILNPGGDKYDPVRYAETGKEYPDSGPGNTRSDTTGVLGGASAAQALPDRTSHTATTDQSHLGRDAALGGGAAATAAAGYEAEKYASDPSRTAASGRGEPATSTHTERAFPLGGGTTTHSTYDAPSSTTQPPMSQTTDPYGTTSSTAASNQPQYGRDAAIAGGVGAGALGAGVLAREANRPKDDLSQGTYGDRSNLGASGYGNTSSQTYPDPVTAARTGAHHHGAGQFDDDDMSRNTVGGHHHHEAPAEGYVHHTRGPHALDAANRLDPHVPGEYPDETGQDRHAHHTGRDVGSSTIGDQRPSTSTAQPPLSSAAYDGAQSYPSQATEPSSSQQHHYGRDAALAGGAGAAGLGAYELTKDDDPAVAKRDRPIQPRAEDVILPGGNATAPTAGRYDDVRDRAPTAALADPVQSEHHYGRDAAMAGGAGAVGAGAYEATRDRGDAGPASQTIGSHGSTTTGPHRSGLANNMDSRVESYPSAAPEKEHHYGRDAAIAGGAGTVGAGAYEATRDRGDTGPASNTLGPHESNLANIVDPRVQPQADKMKDPVTTGPHRSDIANTADPRVKSSRPAQVEEREQPHYGRDAAIAGGAGAAGLGAYEASKDHGASTAPTQQVEPAKHEHNKLHKRNDPRGHHDDPRGHPVYGVSAGTDDKHEKDLRKAREEEAKKAHEQHGEKKEGFLHRMLHPGHHQEQEKHASDDRAVPQAYAQQQQYQQPPASELGQSQRIGTDGPIGEDRLASGNPDPIAGGSSSGLDDGIKIEPHTGLPMNVGKYGEGAGGTDAAPQIPGYHRHEEGGEGVGVVGGEGEGARGADWEGIRKANTPY